MRACAQLAAIKQACFLEYISIKSILTTLKYVLRVFKHVEIIKKCFGSKLLFFFKFN